MDTVVVELLNCANICASYQIVRTDSLFVVAISIVHPLAASSTNSVDASGQSDGSTTIIECDPTERTDNPRCVNSFWTYSDTTFIVDVYIIIVVRVYINH